MFTRTLRLQGGRDGFTRRARKGSGLTSRDAETCFVVQVQEKRKDRSRTDNGHQSVQPGLRRCSDHYSTFTPITRFTLQLVRAEAERRDNQHRVRGPSVSHDLQSLHREADTGSQHTNKSATSFGVMSSLRAGQLTPSRRRNVFKHTVTAEALRPRHRGSRRAARL